jgi:hypothetical protein
MEIRNLTESSTWFKDKEASKPLVQGFAHIANNGSLL